MTCGPDPVICIRKHVVELLNIGGTMIWNFIGGIKLLRMDLMTEQDVSLVLSNISF